MNLRPIQVFNEQRIVPQPAKPPYYEKVPTFQGLFHSWGVCYEEFSDGPGNYTVAIVELPDGSIITPAADLVKFLTPLTQPS